MTSLCPRFLLPLLVSFVAVAAAAGCGEQESTAPPPPPPPPPPPAMTAPPPPPAPSAASPSDSADAGATPAAQGATYPASTPLNELTMNMMRALKGEKGNLFFSGASLRGALGMTALGAKGPTLDEMAKALAVDGTPAKNQANAKAERDAWTAAAGKATLTIANRAWIQKSFAVEKTFLDAAKAGYGAEPASIDFAGAPDPSRKTINAWVSAQTKGHIADLLPSGSIDPLTRLVLTNAVYFKGNWAEPFTKTDTKDESFVAATGAKSVPTMHRTGSMAYAENADVQLVQLPYKDSDLVMLVALPKRAEQMDALAGSISGGQVDAWRASVKTSRVVLSLPKFTYAWGRSVKAELEALGIKTAFGDGADFTGMAKPKKAGDELKISDVFHKAFVLVDETGTEAAAATGVVMTTKAVMFTNQVVMKVDHPFLFFVVNGKSGDVLFAGKVVDPKP